SRLKCSRKGVRSPERSRKWRFFRPDLGGLSRWRPRVRVPSPSLFLSPAEISRWITCRLVGGAAQAGRPALLKAYLLRAGRQVQRSQLLPGESSMTSILKMSGVVCLLCAAVWIGDDVLAEDRPDRPKTAADVEALVTELSNWGRWGKDDQLGALN